MEWVAAGFDEGAFWVRSLRAIQRSLRGARLARRRRLADAGQAAWIGANADQRDLSRWLDGLDSNARPAGPVEWGHNLADMAAKLPVISMDEHRKRLKGSK